MDLLLDEFVLSWCGIRVSIESRVLGGVYSAEPVGGGWSVIAQGSCLAITAHCVVEGRMLGAGHVELVCGCVFISFSGMELICGGVHLWGGDLWRLGSGACV
ncbi:hypothetical protein CHARACLAT_023917 [Characodon lateralis]|uniref:Uncharacterized protein n=1 Tax=Characodon lateralis TaxID=208331 RepID=A0ABU7D0A2_9TELE|nr:hypothetical protein [Characodon lateralis]